MQTEDVWQNEMNKGEEEEEGERNQIDAAVFAVDRYLSFPATEIRSLFGALEALRGSLITRGETCRAVFNQPFVTSRCIQSSLHGVKSYKSAERKDNICR